MRAVQWIFILVVSASLAGEAPRGGIVLQFDDGWTSWRTLIAPELERVGGKATGFVNNQYIHNRRIGFEDLRDLQNRFGWEIGTHTYNHHNAIRYVQQNGLENWLETQLDRSLAELRAEGLQVRQLVFPFNAYTPEIARAALTRVDSFRRADPIALASAGRRPDGSLPGTAIDLTRFIPNAILFQWVDMAWKQDKLLYVYGHRVLPDEKFVTGVVVSVTANEIVADRDIVLPVDEDVVLVPDLKRRGRTDSPGRLTADGRRIRTVAGGPDLTRLTAPGATFMIGPAYGTRLSDFRGLLDHAAGRLRFLTVTEAAGEETPGR